MVSFKLVLVEAVECCNSFTDRFMYNFGTRLHLSRKVANSITTIDDLKYI